MIGDGGPDQHAPGQPPRGRRAPRALAWLAVVITAVLVAGVLSAYAAYRGVFDRIHRVTVTGLGARPPGYNHSLNILVIGSDTRQGKNRRFGAHITGQRSDTIMVLHLSPGFRRAVVLSIPRDSVVPVLSCPAAAGFAGQAAQPGQVEQVNATFATGGPGCLWKTIEHTTHIRLDHFVELNFTGFEHVINDLGGVNICLPYPINDPHSRLHLSSGLHHVMGWAALAYWRVRYIGMGSDLERIKRDQYLMASLAQSAKRSNLLGDPPRLYRVVSDIASSLTTDSRLTQDMLISLAQSVRTLPLSELHFVEAPVVFYPPNPNWVEWAPQAGSLFSAIAHDRKVPRSHHAARAAARRTAGRHAAAQPSSGRAAHTGQSPAPGPPSTPAGSAHPAPTSSPAGLSGLTRNDGGVSAGANICRDTGAFAGPLGGH